MKTLALITLVFGLAAPALADDLTSLQHGWATANYTLDGDAQKEAFERLIAQAEAATARHPEDARLLIWQGIIQSTYAGTAGLSALKWVKAARKSLESALDKDPAALDGSAYTSLGALYYQVPGWPIAFGNDDKAREYLEQARAINPDGIDTNYFYGDFLFNEKEYPEAREALRKALAAPARPGREDADAGRRKEIRELLMRVDEKLG